MFMFALLNFQWVNPIIFSAPNMIDMQMDELNKKITELTEKIRKEKPTLYKHLIENPHTIPTEGDPLSKKTLLSYYESLLAQYENS